MFTAILISRVVNRFLDLFLSCHCYLQYFQALFYYYTLSLRTWAAGAGCSVMWLPCLVLKFSLTYVCVVVIYFTNIIISYQWDITTTCSSWTHSQPPYSIISAPQPTKTELLVLTALLGLFNVASLSLYIPRPLI